MIAVDCYQFRLLLKNISNFTIVLLTQISLILFFTILIFKFLIFSPSFFTRFRVCQGYRRKLKSQKRIAINGIASIIYTSLVFKSSNCHFLFAFTTRRYWWSTKLRSTSSTLQSLANGWQLISNIFSKVLSWP